jgi:hypothetical protein
MVLKMEKYICWSKKCASSAVGLGNISEEFGMEVLNNFKSVKNMLK